jgi:glycosyltransferase involved in cell wall biosynthesis
MQNADIIVVSGKHPLTAKSGYARYAAGLCRELAKKRRVQILCTGPVSRIEKSAIGTIHVIGSAYARILPGREMIAFVPICASIARQVPTGSIVWGIGPWTLAGAYAHPKKLIADYFTTIGHEWHTPIFSPFERYLLRRSNRIITHYRSTEKILRKEFCIAPEKFLRIPYRTERLPQIPLLITVCRQEKRKGIRYLIEAYRILNRQGIPFQAFIVGSGPELNRNIHLASDLPNVKFLGELADVGPFLRSTFCFVLPSLEEGSGSIAIREAMAEGLPVIATNIDGIPEDMKNGYNGILVPPKNPKKLADAMEYVIRNPARVRKFATNALKSFRTSQQGLAGLFSEKFFEILFS